MVGVFLWLACAPEIDAPSDPWVPPDADGDGFPDAYDCDANDAGVHAGAALVLGDPVDRDCDGWIWCVWDADGDGHGVASGTTWTAPAGTPCTALADDCDDADPAVHPGAVERLGNDVDENCDGETRCVSAVDSDGDSVCDDLDVCPGVDDRLDRDGDGQPDGCDPCPDDPGDDADGDGICDGLDADPDGDGLGAEDEAARGTRTDAVDSDADNLCDGWVAVDHCIGAELVEGTDPTRSDTDGDGLDDGEEVYLWHTEPTLFDTDGDGAGDGVEITYGSDPFVMDTDGDGLLDGAEYFYGGDPLGPDGDGDGLSDFDEVFLYGSSPGSTDGDGDGWSDVYEIEVTGTNPGDADTDHDGLIDSEEELYGLDPFEPDADSDGLLDGDELALGSDPFDVDTDGDGLLDGREFEVGSDPTVIDTDGDGLDDWMEVEATGTDPALADSDGDGLDDPAEIFLFDSNPVDPDTDDDGMLDGEEWDLDLDPNDKDTDDDCLMDGEEAALGADPAVWDTDGDGLHDGIENRATGTDPSRADTDGDGVLDPEDAGIDCDVVDCTLCLGAFHVDADGDAYGDPLRVVYAVTPSPGAVLDATDCDDGDATVFPGAPERCDDGALNDCDGDILAADLACTGNGAVDIGGAARTAFTTSAVRGAGAAAAAGDAQGDGVVDLWIGAPTDGLAEAGRIYRWAVGPGAAVNLDTQAEFGTAVAVDQHLGAALAAFDGDGDGATDLVGGGPDAGSGKLWLWLGPDGPALAEAVASVSGAALGDRLGAALAAGAAGVLAGAPGGGMVLELPWDLEGVWVGADGASAAWLGDFGTGGAVALGDLDGDGVDERLVATSPDGDVHILGPGSGIGSVDDALATFRGSAAAALAVGDLDNDGHLEWSTSDPMAATAWLLPTGIGDRAPSDALSTLQGEPGDGLGASMLLLSEFRDEAAEWVVGAPQADGDGTVWTFAGPPKGALNPSDATWTLLASGVAQGLGRSFAAVPDLDGDGRAELYVGQDSAGLEAGYLLVQHDGL